MYKLGRGRSYKGVLYQWDCVTNMTDIGVNRTNPVPFVKNARINAVVWGYSLNKAQIAVSDS